MSYAAKVGSFNIDTSKTAGQSQAVSGVGFQPTIVLFFWGGSTATGDSAAGGTLQFGFGAGISSSERVCFDLYSQDGQDTTVCYRTRRDDACIYAVTAAQLIEGAADLASMDADGFTLTIDDQFANAYRVSYLALGGTDLTNVKAGIHTGPTGTGSYAQTGLGFKPDALIYLTDFGTRNSIITHGSFSLGLATASSAQGVISGYATNAAATSTTYGYGYNGEIRAYPNAGPVLRDTFVSFDDDGFTFNCLEYPGQYHGLYIALKGGQYSVGDITTRTDGNDIAETVGFQPAALLFGSVNRALSTQDAATAHLRASLGAATGPSERACAAVSDENGLAASETAFANYDSAVYAFVQDDAAVGLMDLKSIDANGFTCVMDDTDPSGCWVTYLAIGALASAPAWRWVDRKMPRGVLRGVA